MTKASMRIAGASAATLLFVLPAAAQSPNGPLAGLQPGLWQLRAIGGASGPAPRSVCVRNPVQLLQIRHGGQRCSRRVLDETADTISVRYTCPGGEWGQTELRVETARLANIDTQGIAGGAPFHQIYEARRTGDCR